MNATYSPEDNKLRLYSVGRLDADTYARVRAAGFRWAPKQELWVAPMWTPEREDLLLELCGEVGDEDTSLVDRAEERAERFGDYADSRRQDAESARAAVSAIADNIPLGQPILVGHHSERHARKDAERIENGMRKAVKMWETSQYWTDRAKGAIRAAKYKERPDVRARRIKTLEAEIRKCKAKFTPADHSQIMQTPWYCPVCHQYACHEHPEAQAKVPHVWCAPKGGRGGSWVPLADLPTIEAHYSRWITHYENRLSYERAMLADQGGTVADRTGPEKGGACRCWASPGLGRGWSYIVKVNKVSVSIQRSAEYGGDRIFSQTMPLDKLKAVLSKAEVEAYRAAGKIQETADKAGFYLMESREQWDAKQQTENKPPEPPAEREFAAMKETLRAGIQTVSAPQLFPTPPELARRMVALCGEVAGLRVLEPSAGTGNLIRAIADRATGFDCVRVVAVEINHQLAGKLREMRQRFLYANETNFEVKEADFLCCDGELGKFDVVVMNPPFENGADIKHIRHALSMLKPGGRLVALCANGPRQREAFRDEAEHWEDLPAGSFKEAGTNVNVALLVLTR